ncbi:MAG TPA: hypothetical protein VMS40_26895, partial [Vicinamibacterales bacterium]|nr:hypothetical protein [Vicinamibacterales bacterium]
MRRRSNRCIRALTLAAAIVLGASAAGAQSASAEASARQALVERPARIDGHPNFNGIWQAMNTAYWNL